MAFRQIYRATVFHRCRQQRQHLPMPLHIADIADQRTRLRTFTAAFGKINALLPLVCTLPIIRIRFHMSHSVRIIMKTFLIPEIS
jgi:hypothetical protein